MIGLPPKLTPMPPVPPSTVGTAATSPTSGDAPTGRQPTAALYIVSHRRVWALAGPIILSNLSTPLLGAVDTAVVGRLPDAAYIGGVALGAVLFSFLYWGFGFLRMGTTGFTAQAYGAGNADELRATLIRPLGLALALGFLLILVHAPIGWLAFWLLDGSAAVEGHAQTYYAIRIWSAPATLVNYAILGWLLGTQRAFAALWLQVALNGLNIVLDVVFVIGLDLGIAGVAWATLIAEIIAAIIGCAIAAGALHRHGGRWDRARILGVERWVALLRVNIDIFLRTVAVIFAFSYFTAQGAKMGDITLAANTILMHLQAFMAYGLDGFAHAAEILAGGALGTRSRSSFRAAVRIATAWALATAFAIAVLYALAGPAIIGLFTVVDEVRATAIAFLPWLVVSPLLSVWSFMLDGIFIGATRTGAMRNAMALSLVVFLAASWWLVPAYGNTGLWLALMVLMVTRALTLGAAYPRLERSVGEA